MKKIISVVLQTLLMTLCGIAAAFVRPFHVQRILLSTPALTHIFVWDGLIVVALLFVLIALIEVLTKHVRTALPLTIVAFVLSLLLSVKFGYITHEF